MQIKEVWENAKKDQKNFYFSKNNTEYIRTEHGTVSWNKDIPRKGQWDMGHIVEDINKPNIYAREYDKYPRNSVFAKAAQKIKNKQ